MSSRLFDQFGATRVPYQPTGARIRRLAFGTTATNFWKHKDVPFWGLSCVWI